MGRNSLSRRGIGEEIPEASSDETTAYFIGALATILVGISTLRVGVSRMFGLYGSTQPLVFSGLAAVPGVIGVMAGDRVGRSIPASVRSLGTPLLLSVIGTRSRRRD